MEEQEKIVDTILKETSHETISEEKIIKFLDGHNPEKGVIAVEYDYGLQEISKVIQNTDGTKIIRKDKLKAFAWIKDLKNKNFYENKQLQKLNITKYGITFKLLKTGGVKRLEDGYKYIVHSSKGLNELQNFFREGGLNPFAKADTPGRAAFKDLVLILPPVDQYLISTGIRLFKGFDDYNGLYKVVFDIETHGLDPTNSRVFMIGVKDNKGFEELIEIEDDDISEIKGIFRFFEVILELKPSLLAGYNSENFDWYFIFERARILGIDIKAMCKQMHPEFLVSRKKSMLKLAAEVEDYEQTLIWGFNVSDIIHSVRRAMAINSDIKSAGLKYISKENNVAKTNRTHIEGGKIGSMWNDDRFIYCQKTGGYKPFSENIVLEENEEVVNGKYIVRRYLMDDLQETLDVDNIFGQSSFFISKTIPTAFSRVSTMGTATLWKMLMMAWSYENDLAIPLNESKRDFVGGLSRLIRTGYSKRLVKLDFSSLYPSIQITHDIFPESDITGAMKAMLRYFHKARNEFKAMGKAYEKEGNMELAKLYDTKQLPIKILNNSFFGSLSAPHVFPWGEMDKGEQTTCSARQYLRLMVKFFMDRGFRPVVGDSVSYDTPIFLKHKVTGQLNILAISDLYDENSDKIDSSGLRDYSDKDYLVLTKNGWKDIIYVYRHKTDKILYDIKTKDRFIKATEDHSLFQDGREIKPTELSVGSKIDIIDVEKFSTLNTITKEYAWVLGFFIGDGSATNGIRIVKGYRRKDGKYLHDNGVERKRSDWKISNQEVGLLEKASVIMEQQWGIKATIKDHMKSSAVYELVITRKEVADWFADNCYTKYRHKKVPEIILNSTDEIKKSFIDGFMAADGDGYTLEETKSFCQKSKVVMGGICQILNDLGKEYRLSIRNDKKNILGLYFGNPDKAESKSNIVGQIRECENFDENNYVYDISTEDGTFVGGVGGVLLHNTDGFDFETPDDIDDYKYVGQGNNEKAVKDKLYEGVHAVIAEFNDKYMRGVMGLSLDGEYLSSINLARKNYCNLKLNGKMKLVGNTIKSKKMPGYIEEFVDTSLMMLLHGKGADFVNYYYEYLEKIFNQQIPAIKIASKNKVKLSIEDYIARSKKKNKNGGTLPKMVHMELAIENNLKVNLGDVIYCINNGTMKSHGDTGHSTIVDLKMLEEDVNYVQAYNVPRAISVFNKRIEPFMVVFHPDVRDRILKSDPSKRELFTNTELEMVNGFPIEIKDQDSIVELMTPSENEIGFWNKFNYNPCMFEHGIIDNSDENHVPNNWIVRVPDYSEDFNVLEDFWIPGYDNTPHV